MAELYGPDLARIHDEGFGDLAEHAAAFVVDLLRRRGIQRGRVLDLGCGAGQLAAALAKKGYDVCGVDMPDLSGHRTWALARDVGEGVRHPLHADPRGGAAGDCRIRVNPLPPPARFRACAGCRLVRGS